LSWGLIFGDEGVGVDDCEGMMPEAYDFVKDFIGIRLVLDFDLDRGPSKRNGRWGVVLTCSVESAQNPYAEMKNP